MGRRPSFGKENNDDLADDGGSRGAVLLMLAGYAEAQDAGASLVELLQSGELRPGDGVYVTDGAGQRIKGRISDVSSTGLVLIGGQDRWTLASSDVRQIEREDSVANGILIGVGVGAGLGVWSCGDGCYQGANRCFSIPPSASVSGGASTQSCARRSTVRRHRRG